MSDGPLSIHPDFAYGQRGIEDGKVGKKVRSKNATVMKAEIACGVGADELGGIWEGCAGLNGVAQGLIEGENAAGKRPAGEADGAIADDDILPAKLTGAFGATRAAHGVRDEKQAAVHQA
jgi:hypothetical protein